MSHCPSYAEVIVVDNASTDDSVAFMRTHYDNVELRVLEQNYGFAGGYREALNNIHATYYLILNSDVELTQTSIDPIINFMDEHSEVGACQPKIRSYQERNKFEYAGACGGWIDRYRYPFCRGRVLYISEEDKGQYDQREKIFWSTGAAMFVRADVYHRAGGFDPAFFAHMEEIDLCWRIQRMGYDIYCIPDAVVYHLGGGTLSYQSPRKTFLNFRNSLYTIVKNERIATAMVKVLIRLLLDGVAGVRFLVRGEFENFWIIIKAHIQFYSTLGYILKQRRQFIMFNDYIFSKKKELDGVWNGSIVVAFFIRGKKAFKNL